MGRHKNDFIEAYAQCYKVFIHSVTLAFKLATKILHVTRWPVMRIMPIHFEFPPYSIKLWAGHEYISMKHMHIV